jgi:NDP-sugar pyrophosphorylase family protein
MLDLIARHTPARVKAFKGYWMDIGRPDDYEQARKDIADGVFKI